MSSSETPDLNKRPCPKCGEPAGEVVLAAEGLRQGWLCFPCDFFVKAIGRERIFPTLPRGTPTPRA